MKKVISSLLILLLVVFIPVSAISQTTKAKPLQNAHNAIVPVFQVSPVTDIVTKISFKKLASAPLLKNVTEKMSSEEIAKLSVKAPVDFTLTPRLPYIEKKGQLGGDRISIVDLWQDNYLIRPETYFGGMFSLEKNKTYLCTVSLTLYPGQATIRVLANTEVASENLSQDFSLNNPNKNNNSTGVYKDVEISFVLKTPDVSGYVQVFLLDKGKTDFFFKKWNVKELAAQN